MSNRELASVLEDPSLREALQRIVKYEEERIVYYKSDSIFKGMDCTPYWEMLQVPLEWKFVRRLLFAGLVKKFGKKYYILTDRSEVKVGLAEVEQDRQLMEEKVELVLEEKKFPEDLFDVIEGYDDLKKFFFITLAADDPVHVLMIGAPGTAKSVFLMELERLGGRFITAGTATKVGIRDILYDELPRLLLLDEIDKIDSSGDLSSLLTWMESGRIIITKHGLKDEKKGKGLVFAAANTLRGLPPELLDRFQVFHIQPYSTEEFIRVVKGYLTKRMNIPEEHAQYIAEKVQEFSVSVRQAIRLARLAKTKEEVDDLLEVIKKYGGDNRM